MIGSATDRNNAAPRLVYASFYPNLPKHPFLSSFFFSPSHRTKFQSCSLDDGETCDVSATATVVYAAGADDASGGSSARGVESISRKENLQKIASSAGVEASDVSLQRLVTTLSYHVAISCILSCVFLSCPFFFCCCFCKSPGIFFLKSFCCI